MERWKLTEAAKILGAKMDKKLGKLRMVTSTETIFDGPMLAAPTVLLDTTLSKMLEAYQSKREQIKTLINAPTRASYMEKRNGTKKAQA